MTPSRSLVSPPASRWSHLVSSVLKHDNKYSKLQGFFRVVKGKLMIRLIAWCIFSQPAQTVGCTRSGAACCAAYRTFSASQRSWSRVRDCGRHRNSLPPLSQHVLRELFSRVSLKSSAAVFCCIHSKSAPPCCGDGLTRGEGHRSHSPPMYGSMRLSLGSNVLFGQS